ncbi:saccharopine dehydrogenase [Actinosynnema sp.]|uniref:saccharopine dehydrogenase n=1 Tax=Actinosynnema sp. TaxID=1872144 RepID=UPI003F861286
MTTRLWLRSEVRSTEQRAPITPADAKTLVDAGTEVTVEDSPRRVFPTADYAAAGCRVVEAGGWVDAPPDVVVVGLKELPDLPERLPHRHVFFGHAYKGQPGARELLGRFAAGGGALLDLEYLTDDDGRRLTAFGYWAGYLGAALTVLHDRGALPTPLRPTGRAELDAALRAHDGHRPTALVVGALGRCGRGARDALAVAGAEVTGWDLAETRTLDRAALLGHDLLVNAVLATGPAEPLLRPEDLDAPRALRGVGDVSCDAGGPYNLLPVYDEVTTWDEPVLRLRDGEHPLDLIAIDNLPSLLAAESSADFSRDLLPHLLDLDSGPWRRCAERFHTTVAALEADHA